MSGPFGSSQMFTVASDYSIDHSLMFHDTDSLTLTPGTAGNRKTFTYSVWVKRTKFAGSMMLFAAGNNSGSNDYMMFQGNDHIAISYATEGSGNLVTDARFRDPSAWYHLVWAQDTNQSTAANRVKIYVNGVLQTLQNTSYPAEDYEGAINDTVKHKIGGRSYDAASFFDGYMAEAQLIDGLALDPTYFAETGDYGEWKPKQQYIVFGDEGFWLRFNHKATGSGAVGRQGEDSSGNNNHWTTSNTIQDNQMESESPTNNFPTYNPLAAPGSVFQEGNRTLQTSGNVVESGVGTMAIPLTGKWYWECYPRTLGGTQQYGIVPASHFFAADADYPSNDGVNGYAYLNTGQKSNNDSAANYGNSFTTGDIIGVAYDADNRLLYFYKNNTIQNSGTAAYTVAVDLQGYIPAVGTYGNGAIAKINFGQDSSFDGVATGQNNPDGNGIGDFTYTPPSGYLALCTKNLPEPDVVPSEYFNTVLYSGTGSNQDITTGFQPDWVWIKNRGSDDPHTIFDSVRGALKSLDSGSTAAETSTANSLTAFNSNSFTVGSSNTVNNGNNNTYVSWNWKAGTSVSGNSTGAGDDIAYTGSVDTEAGFSIIKYGGNASTGHQIPHRLGVVPDMIWIKNITTQSWNCWWPNTSLGATTQVQLDNGSAQSDQSWINNTMPTASVVELEAGAATNARDGSSNPQPYVMYSFKSIPGHSKMDIYKGNGSADGTFVNCGFRPAFVLMKVTGLADERWMMYDNKRDPFNFVSKRLVADDDNVESSGSGQSLDFLSNGFKLRANQASQNSANYFYVYMAMAETPFKYSNAR